METDVAYAMMHATRPATISIVLSSSPIALLAWMGEKFFTWSDAATRLETETILAFVSLYWVTRSFARGIYPYRGDFDTDPELPKHGGEKWMVPEGMPFGFSEFPCEIQPVPRAWVERTGRVTCRRSHDRGGHFAALECPGDMLTDLEDFVAHFREMGRI